MPLVLGGSSAAAAAYSIDNSCRFNQPDDASMTLTMGTPTNADKFSLSMWVKRGSRLDEEGTLYTGGTSSSNGDILHFYGTGELQWQMYHGSYVGRLKTNRQFLDSSAWYHFLFVYDSGNADASLRMRIYINGTEETSFDLDVNPALNLDSLINSANLQAVADDGGLGLTNKYFDGYLADVILCDGQTYTPSDFGEFDSDSPTIWKPKDPSGLTFGNNGTWLDFKDSANLGNDANGGSDWAEQNLAAADQATDTPTNNFAVLNYLSKDLCSPSTFSEGNCKTAQGSDYAWNLSTLGMSAGKWYFEDYIIDVGTVWSATGITSRINPPNRSWTPGVYGPGYSNDTYGVAMTSYAGSYYKEGSASSYGSVYTTGAIIGCALDLDNDKVYFSKDGDWGDGSGTWDSSTFDAAVGDIALVAAASATDSGVYHFAVGNQSGSPTHGANFGGCPPIAPSSGNADDNGYGNFEYAPPTGFLALCTQNLGSDGG